ncbi:MAG: hypothetical protein COW88_03215 [Candidatus Lloydbacteria bacterium CG22_combo_CG10-13_8_21_14_all_47_15]|uniref:Uncharacterized protein n=1 Tax=Candidatus Lloydbacteria bacterium CG22_combo_CG10-13_8_21_14_all_47_15 TaxID=1974635 RepID=A0A2H0CT04_9BACT|nr:MAG: hypothetical protein COW88_03215 [Candidatus Lloydbacteria bacterium CG22_combo_CG10-13_8_21_14_all_47_15]
MDKGNPVSITKIRNEARHAPRTNQDNTETLSRRVLKQFERFDTEAADAAGTAKKSALIALALSVLLAGAGGFYFFITKVSVESLEKEALLARTSGNYAAALALYDRLQQNTPDDDSLGEIISDTQALFIAQANYASAEGAAEEGRWFDVRALLRGSVAVSNPDFISYNGALALLEHAEAEISSLAELNASQVAELAETAELEALRRRQIEAERLQAVSELRTRLEETTSAKANAEAELATTQAELSQSQEEIQKAQSEYERERAKAQALAEAAERERHANFLSDLQGYVTTISNGEDKLRVAAAALSAGDDEVAYLRTREAQTLFEEAHSVGDLRGRDVVKSYQATADTALRAIIAYEDALAKLKKAIVLNDPNDEAYGAYLNEYETMLGKAVALRQEVEAFIAERK